MMTPRWRKVIADIWGHKVRSLLVIASITIGLFAVGMITSMSLIIRKDMKAGYESINPANIQIFSTNFDQDLVDAVRNIDGVRQSEGVRTFTLRFKNANGEWVPIEIKAIPDIETSAINRVLLEDGTWPPRDRQVVVDVYKLEDIPGGLGGTLEVELPSGKIRQMPVVGVIHDQTIGSEGAGGFFLAPAQGYVTYDTLQWLGMPEAMNRLYVTVDKNNTDREYLQKVANEVIDVVEASGHVVIFSQVRPSDDHPNRVYVEAITAVLAVLSLLVMFLSAFLITNTLAALLNQQINHIGVMKTIGARRFQIVGVYMALIFAYSLTAFVIALPLSAWTAYKLMEFFGNAINIVLQG